MPDCDDVNRRNRRTAHRPFLIGPCSAGARSTPRERAQSTVEYAILLLGAAAVAMLVVAWVSDSDVIGRLFETVFDKILSRT